MKKFSKYILSALLVTLAVGCEDAVEQDQDFIDSFDNTLPAYVVAAQSLKVVTNSAGLLLWAGHANDYFFAPDEEAQRMVEDKFFYYQKLREERESLLVIYDQKSSEIYDSIDRSPLNEVGSAWRVLASSRYLGYKNSEGSYYNPEDMTLECTGEQSYNVTMADVNMPLCSGIDDDGSLLGGLQRLYQKANSRVSGAISFQTNDLEYRDGYNVTPAYVAEGEYVVVDPAKAGYKITATIAEPLRIDLGSDGVVSAPITGKLNIELTNGLGELERIEVTMSPMKVIMVDYRTGGKRYRGYYNWQGDCITPGK